MKKYKLAINALLLLIFIASIIAFSLICDTTQEHWYIYNELYRDSLKEITDEMLIGEIHDFYNETLCLTFSIIFSALSTIASAVTAVLLNLIVFKEDN